MLPYIVVFGATFSALCVGVVEATVGDACAKMWQKKNVDKRTITKQLFFIVIWPFPNKVTVNFLLLKIVLRIESKL